MPWPYLAGIRKQRKYLLSSFYRILAIETITRKAMQDFIISAQTLHQLQISPTELMVDLAVYLYDKERLTMGQAKKLAGLTQLQFQQELAKRNVFIKYDVEDFAKDMDTLSWLD